MTGLVYDPTSPRWRDDPYPVYRRLRDEAPVHWSDTARMFCVSRHEDVQRVLNDPDTFSSRAMFTIIMNRGEEGMPPLRWDALRAMARITWASRATPFAFLRGRQLIASDGAVHTGMRNVVNRGFTPRRVQAWAPRVRQIVHECLARLRGGGDFDVVRDLAVPLPVTVIAEMLGIESQRRGDFKRWSDTIIHYTTGSGRADPFARPLIDATVEFTRCLRTTARARREAPTDDLVSVLVGTQDGEQGVSDCEILMFVNLLLVAGNETTTNLIGNATNALLDHPSELARVAADASRVPALVEEALRWDAPVQVVFRTATRDTELRGVRIPAGAWVAPLIGSANRDERRFPDPDRFDVSRDVQGHLGFGFGKHFCLGASLARLEATVALEALAPELLRRRRSEARVERVDSFLVRGPRRLLLAPAA